MFLSVVMSGIADFSVLMLPEKSPELIRQNTADWKEVESPKPMEVREKHEMVMIMQVFRLMKSEREDQIIPPRIKNPRFRPSIMATL